MCVSFPLSLLSVLFHRVAKGSLNTTHSQEVPNHLFCYVLISFLFLTVAKYASHNIYHVNRCEGYNSVVFSTTDGCCAAITTLHLQNSLSSYLCLSSCFPGALAATVPHLPLAQSPQRKTASPPAPNGKIQGRACHWFDWGPVELFSICLFVIVLFH